MYIHFYKELRERERDCCLSNNLSLEMKAHRFFFLVTQVASNLRWNIIKSKKGASVFFFFFAICVFCSHLTMQVAVPDDIECQTISSVTYLNEGSSVRCAVMAGGKSDVFDNRSSTACSFAVAANELHICTVILCNTAGYTKFVRKLSRYILVT